MGRGWAIVMAWTVLSALALFSAGAAGAEELGQFEGCTEQEKERHHGGEAAAMEAAERGETGEDGVGGEVFELVIEGGAVEELYDRAVGGNDAADNDREEAGEPDEAESEARPFSPFAGRLGLHGWRARSPVAADAGLAAPRWGLSASESGFPKQEMAGVNPSLWGLWANPRAEGEWRCFLNR